MEFNKKTMKVKFNKDLTSIDEIQKAISNIGYDTAKHRALMKFMKNYIIVASMIENLKIIYYEQKYF